MRNAIVRFNAALRSARDHGGLYEVLDRTVGGPHTYDDLLRFQIVFSVSAFDKLIHDIIRIGMLATYEGTRAPTAKYLAEAITIKHHQELILATIPPASYYFEQGIVRRYRHHSYQDPKKAAEGLALVWEEKHKWQKIGADMGMTGDEAADRLKVISVKRNAIVHEADLDPMTHTKNTIDKSEADSVVSFISACGSSIARLVAL